MGLPRITVNRVVVFVLIVSLCLLIYLTYPLPRRLLLIGVLVSIIGILWLYLATRTKNKSWKDLFRDVGIACIVAVVVTVIYEASTRTDENEKTFLSGINKAMAEFIPKRDWEEITQDVIRQNRIRTNIKIEFKLLRKARLANGTYINAPSGQIILWMKYGYDLYAVGPGAKHESVKQELAYEMWSPELQIPRFEKISVIRDHGQNEDPWQGERLQNISDGKSIVLGPEIIKLPDPIAKQSIGIVSERYELMGAPGSYKLVIPELTLRLSESEPTIRVDVTEIPPELDVSLNTYAEHKFTPTGNRDHSWVYNNVMLAGQGFTLIVHSKPKASSVPASGKP